LKKLFLMGLGGFIGTILRYGLSGYVQQALKNASFPYGTMAVNLSGCLIIGFLSQLADMRGVFSSTARVVIFVGLLGGFTTFSSFANETAKLMRDGQGFYALMNATGHMAVGLAAVWLGYALAYFIWK
jgi:fluoride exporter